MPESFVAFFHEIFLPTTIQETLPVIRPLSLPAVPAVLSILLLSLSLVSALASPSMGEEPETVENPYRSLKQKADALVTLRFVIAMRAPGVDREADSEITCLGIDPEGLVLCSHTELGGYLEVLARLMGRPGAPISANPKDLEVRIEGQSEGLAASLVARDSDRDLAWVQIANLPEGLSLPSVDLAHAAEPEVGQKLYQVRRLDPFFGSVPVVSESVVAAVVDRPRRLIVPSEPWNGRLGMPAFTADGRLLGLSVTQVPSDEESAAVMGSRSRNLPGQPGREEDMVGGVLLPAADLLKATALARETWEADRQERLE